MPLSRPSAARRPAPAALLLAVLVLLAGCTGRVTSAPATSTTDTDAGVVPPDAAVAQFVAAWQAGAPAAIADLTSDPATAGVQITSVVKNLAPTSIAVSTGAVSSPAPDTVAVTASFVWTMPKGISWKYRTSWFFHRSGPATWKADWKPTVIHPQLDVGQSLALRTSTASGGSVVDRNNQQLVVPVTVYSVVALPGKITDLPATAAALQAVLKPLDPTATVASIVAGVKAADPKIGYTITNLREADYRSVAARLAAIPGLTLPSRQRELPSTKDFAKVLLAQVEGTASKLEAGTPGWQIVSIDASGAALTTLAGQDGKPGGNVVLTLDSGVQKAAEAALAGTGEPAVLVAIAPSSGEILAVAQNAPANALGPIALTGQYPPGSTFKIATATAGVQAGVITPSTSVDCPGEYVVDSRAIHNEGFQLGTVSLTTAFARSCNTTFAKLATELPADALTRAAAEYGIGRDFVIPGVTTLTGKVPPADSDVQKAENGFGQGVVLVTPFSAALMAATVAHGSMPMPSLIKGAKTTIDQPVAPLPPAVATALPALMRAVVTDGTATVLGADGQVYAKTGTADYTDAAGRNKAHAWTVGYRGDLAFSVLIVGGDTSKRTNLLADAFLKSLPG